MNLTDAMLGHRRLEGMGFSKEAIRAALSRRPYESESEIIDACHQEQMRLLKAAKDMSLVDGVAALQSRHDQLSDLVDEIAATFSIDRNRDELMKTDSGCQLLGIADSWIRRLKAIRAN